jgi:hypothetical protein
MIKQLRMAFAAIPMLGALSLHAQTTTPPNPDEPATIHYKGVKITPVAFFAAEDVFRTRSVSSDINTPFNSTPYPGSSDEHVSEFNFSGRQSRVGALFEGQAKGFKLSGYVEADFLGSAVTSNGNQSNSFVLRQRQFWGKAETDGGFAITGGQMWSLVTEDGRRTDARTEKLPNTIDAQYNVGFSWLRQAGIRVQQTFGDVNTGALTAALSLEQAQIVNETATASPTNFFFGTASGSAQNGGLFNAFNGTPTNNDAPDIIVKLAYDAPMTHIELGGLARFMRERYYPYVINASTGAATLPTTAAGGTNLTVLAGGLFGSVRVSPSKYVDLAVQLMGGDGVGRYGSSQLADATVHPDGRLEPVRNYHGMASIETHPTSKLDVYAYYGGEYAQRTQYFNYPGSSAANSLVGYGTLNTSITSCETETVSNVGTAAAPSGCSAATRYIYEPTVGWTYKIVESKKYGTLRYQLTYSFLEREAWKGVTGGTYGTTATFGTPKATNSMVFTSIRYYIP